MTEALMLVVMISACGGGGGGGGGTTTDGQVGVDTTPPSITAQDPASAATAVPLDVAVNVTFSEPMEPMSIDSMTFSLEDGDTSIRVSGNVSYDGAARTATFTPGSALEEYRNYRVVLDGVTDEALNPLPRTEWTFQTADQTPPVSTASPAGGHYNTAQNITLACSDVAGSGCSQTVYSIDGTAPATEYTSPIALEAAPATEKKIELRFQSVDQEGNREVVRLETYVMDTVPPSVTDVFPVADATSVVLGTAITATLTEPILPASVTSTVVTVEATDHTIVGEAALDATGTVLTFTPDAPLECNTPYTVQIAASIADLAGNEMGAPYAWTFTTSGDCAAPRTSITPYGGVIRAASQNVTLSCSDTGTPTSGCRRMVYTMDGTTPSFEPVNGTVVEAATADVILGLGHTNLRVMSEDMAGNLEAMQKVSFALSDDGFTYVGTWSGLYRGTGSVPDHFEKLPAPKATFSDGKSMVRDPSNGRIYLVSGDLYVSDDGGTTWTARESASSDTRPESVAALGNRVYVGGFRGVYVSTNGGGSFELTAFTSWVEDLLLLGHKLYVSNGNELWISRDRGDSYTKLIDVDASILAGSGDTLFVGTHQNGLLVSTDGGQTFNARTTANGLGSNKISDLAFVDGILYVATGDDGASGVGGLSISTDGGSTFTHTTAGIPSDPWSGINVESVAVNGSDVYIACWFDSDGPEDKAVAVSNDGGASFTTVTSMHEGLASNLVTSLLVDGGRVFAFTRNGLSISDDGGASFTTASLPGQVSSIAMDPFGKLYVAGGDDAYSETGGLAVSADSGASFDLLGLAQGLPTHLVKHLAISSDGQKIHATTSDISFSDYPAGYSRSLDGGASFSGGYSSPDPLSMADGPIVQHEDGMNTAVYIATGFRWHYSHDGGATFTTEDTPSGMTQDAVDVAVAPDGTVYVGTGEGIGVSTDKGVSFPIVRTTADGLGANRIGVMYHDGTTLFARVMGDLASEVDGLSFSQDGGQSFQTLTTADGLPSAQIWSVHSAGGRWYVGTSRGLAITSDMGGSFVTRDSTHGLSGEVYAIQYVP